MKAGAERIFCSTICMSAVYWLSISPENMPAPLVRNGGSPTLRAGLVSRFMRRSESTQTMVTAAPSVSIGRLTGVPWKLAPVSTSVVLGQEDRVVADAVGLDLDLLSRPAKLVAGGADHLRGRAHAVGVLDLDLLLAGDQVGALHDLDAGWRRW